MWKKIIEIKNEETIYYSELAQKLNLRNSTRAIASSVSKNLILLLISSHRVISKNKNIINFRFGSEIKKWLLFLEN
ncbi:methylated-DNA--[protein]-cysteine S-methyltransferase [Spiroplasma taiwanense]|uniref:methylated-DNA--[protein]-cysteine S-methyltransferase n=1 Tax=Spiroplasma taiwanense TaxID=2145 RepID=UPI00041373CE|nr:methylated-DNA--[protein]-cysteine S-methyltransferase [Spiroplasma taiwanense]